jgi:hypothetical protein
MREYRLAIRQHGQTRYHTKRDEPHAEKGVSDAKRDAERQHAETEIWVEGRTVTQWAYLAPHEYRPP